MSDIKKYFVSRFGENGYILEADYSQLEVYTLAELSGDKQLQNDLLSGVDIHGVMAEKLFGPHYTDKQRKIAKGLSFQLQYGAGAKSMAKTHNLSEEQCDRFIREYYMRYFGVRNWHEILVHAVKNNRTPSKRKTPSGYPCGESYYSSVVSGREYTFVETDAPSWLSRKGIRTTFSPTKIKNFMVQGTATGDIVPLALGKLLIVLKNNKELKDKCFLVNTVHDSVVLDVHEDVLYTVSRIVKEVMQNIGEDIETHWGYTWNMPFKVDLEYGRNWAELQPLILD